MNVYTRIIYTEDVYVAKVYIYTHIMMISYNVVGRILIYYVPTSCMYMLRHYANVQSANFYNIVCIFKIHLYFARKHVISSEKQ